MAKAKNTVAPSAGAQVAEIDPAADDEEDLSSLRTKHTGVDNTIWVSVQMGQHGPRVKIAVDPPDSLVPGGKIATMTIDPPYKVTGANVPTHIIKQVQAFIELNRDVLMDHWNGKIDSIEMGQRIGE